MKTRTSMKKRQRGAVAVLVGISMIMLIGLLALVIDLGHLYLAKTGLQNAADAAALSGAKQLDGTAARICCDSNSAVYMAVSTGEHNTFFGDIGQNQVELGDPSSSTNPYIQLSNSPDGTWVDIATAMASPGDKFFIKVDTASQNLNTWFAPIFNLINGGSNNFQTSTFGVAVAGAGLTNVMPLAVCALNPADTTNYGYQPGVSYNIMDINTMYPGLSPGDQLWLHPTATGNDSHSECPPNMGATSKFDQFVCMGKSAIKTAGTGTVYVYTNTGISADTLTDALNTRFGLYPNNRDYTAAKCAPDVNVKQFTANGYPAGSQPTNKDANWMQQWNGIAWVNYVPTYKKIGGKWTGQGATISNTPAPISADPAQSVVGSYIQPLATYSATMRVSPASAVSPSTPYPTPSPFASGLNSDGTCASSTYCQAPGSGAGTGVRGRRVMSLVLVNCNLYSSPGGGCKALPTLAIARFFMPVKANLPNSVYGEFVDAATMPLPVDTATIKLYQ